MIDKKDPLKKEGEEKKYFGMMEEAIVVECTKKFLKIISKNEIFREEIEALDSLKKWIASYYRRNGVVEEIVEEFEKEIKYISNPIKKVEDVLAFSEDEVQRSAFTAGMFSSLSKEGGVDGLERYIERKKLYELLDKIVSSSKGKFTSRDEVFEHFARANFSGKYLPLARMVEDILGKGSFRKIAEDFSTEPK